MLQAGVDVWRVDLREVDKELLRLLSPDERKRAAGIDNPARRALWMRGRGVLRMLLGNYLRRPAGELEFVVGEYGKPALLDPTPDSRSQDVVHFNLSHSGPLALYAFTSAAPVGIDLEVEKARKLDEPALAERTFGVDAARRLSKLDAPARRQEFMRLWVRHEAALKCLGYGLIGTGAGGGGSEAEHPELWIAELERSPELVAAVAVQGGSRELRRWDWPPRPR